MRKMLLVALLSSGVVAAPAMAQNNLCVGLAQEYNALALNSQNCAHFRIFLNKHGHLTQCTAIDFAKDALTRLGCAAAGPGGGAAGLPNITAGDNARIIIGDVSGGAQVIQGNDNVLAAPAPAPAPIVRAVIPDFVIQPAMQPSVAPTPQPYAPPLQQAAAPAPRVESFTPDYDLGFAAYGRGDYATALKHWRPLAHQGHASAMNNLGSLYQEGHGVAQDYAQAKYWYEKAINKGNASAMNNLGYLYEKSWGVAQDYAQAKYWYEKAIAKGHAAAMNNLGWLYQQGWGVVQDDAKAARWFRKAANAGSPAGAYNLAFVYENGRGVVRDIEQAKHWYRIAAQRGHEKAKAALRSLGE